MGARIWLRQSADYENCKRLDCSSVAGLKSSKTILSPSQEKGFTGLLQSEA